ncbi:hypothetical protein [Terracoccus luteus]|jgi:hypothetical protein|nr:hypothetical protein [Terracoccus luteus]
MDAVMPYVLALVPTIGVGALFYVVIKNLLEGDRRERLAQARWEAEHRDTPAPPPARTASGGDEGNLAAPSAKSPENDTRSS